MSWVKKRTFGNFFFPKYSLLNGMFVSIGSSIFAWSLSGLTELFFKDVFNSDRKDYCRSGRGEKSMSSWFLFFFFFFCLEDLILAVFSVAGRLLGSDG